MASWVKKTGSDEPVHGNCNISGTLSASIEALFWISRLCIDRIPNCNRSMEAHTVVVLRNRRFI